MDYQRCIVENIAISLQCNKRRLFHPKYHWPSHNAIITSVVTATFRNCNMVWRNDALIFILGPYYADRTNNDVNTWWRHQMEIFSALLALCVGNSPVTGEFPTQRPVTGSFDVFFDLLLNKRLSKQWWGWWFETLSRPLWCHCNDTHFVRNQSGLILVFSILHYNYFT